MSISYIVAFVYSLDCGPGVATSDAAAAYRGRLTHAISVEGGRHARFCTTRSPTLWTPSSTLRSTTRNYG